MTMDEADDALRDSDGEYFDTIASNTTWNWS